MPLDPHYFMTLAIQEGERARGTTGNNPWVGCVIVSPEGEVLGKGHTQGPGEDHAEIDATRDAHSRGHSVEGSILFSTLEPCSFHGRTPACSHSIAKRGVREVFIGMRDPHPRVSGAGIQILRDAGVAVVEEICEAEVRRQLGAWVVAEHPHDVRARAEELVGSDREAVLATAYGVSPEAIRAALGG